MQAETADSLEENIDYVINVITKEAVNEDELVKLILYTCLSAKSNKPINLAINAPPGEGKTHAIIKTIELFRNSDVICIAGMTPKALFHRSGQIVVKDESGKYVSLEKRRDEIEFRVWTTRIIQSILSRDLDEQQQFGVNKKRLEMMETIEFENTLQERIQELKLKLKDCNNLRESDILINEIDTLDSTLGRLMDLKYGDKARAIETAEANHDFKRANRIRKQFVKLHDTEDEINAQYSKTKLKWTA